VLRPFSWPQKLRKRIKGLQPQSLSRDITQQMKHFFTAIQLERLGSRPKGWRSLNQRSEKMEKAKIPSDVKNEWGFDETVYQSSCGAVTKAHRTVHPLWGKILKQLKKENLLHDPFFDYCRTNDLKGDRVLSQVLKARDPHSELLSFFQTNHPLLESTSMWTRKRWPNCTIPPVLLRPHYWMALADTVPTLSASNRGHTLKRLMTGAGCDISQIAWYTPNIKRRPLVKHLHLDGQVSVGQSAKLPARAEASLQPVV